MTTSGTYDDEARAVDPGVEVVRHEEQLRVETVRVPVERVRVGKRIVVEQVTRTVEVRREELVVERLPLVEAEDVDTAPGPVDDGSWATPVMPEPDGAGPLELVLSEEEVVVTTRVVPRERVRVVVERETGQREVSAELGREEVVLEDVAPSERA